MRNLKERFKEAARAAGSLRVLICAALLSAISIVCGKYLAVGVGEVLRFSFENLPVLLSGILFGPIVGAMTGALADIIGCLLVGYTINPLVTAGAAVIGLSSGLLSCLLPEGRLALRVTVCVAVSHLLGSVIIKTYGLAVWYTLPLYELMLWRLLNYLVIGIAEGALLYLLLRNGALQRQIAAMKRR